MTHRAHDLIALYDKLGMRTCWASLYQMLPLTFTTFYILKALKNCENWQGKEHHLLIQKLILIFVLRLPLLTTWKANLCQPTSLLIAMVEGKPTSRLGLLHTFASSVSTVASSQLDKLLTLSTQRCNSYSIHSSHFFTKDYGHGHHLPADVTSGLKFDLSLLFRKLEKSRVPCDLLDYSMNVMA